MVLSNGDIRRICKERCARILTICRANHATPAVCIMIGHDHTSGELHLMVPDRAFTHQQIAALLRKAAEMVEQGAIEKG